MARLKGKQCSQLLLPPPVATVDLPQQSTKWILNPSYAPSYRWGESQSSRVSSYSLSVRICSLEWQHGVKCMSLFILSNVNVYCEEVDNLDVAVADSNPLSMDGKLLPSTHHATNHQLTSSCSAANITSRFLFAALRPTYMEKCECSLAARLAACGSQ